MPAKLKAREMGRTLTHDAMYPSRGLAAEPCLPGLTMAAKEAEETRVLAGATQCGRGWKWGYGGRSVRGFKPRRRVNQFLSFSCFRSGPCGKEGRRAMRGSLPGCLGQAV